MTPGHADARVRGSDPDPPGRIHVEGLYRQQQGHGQWFYVNKAGNHAPTSGSGYRDAPQVSGLWAMILGLDAGDPDTADRKTRLRNILFDTEYYYTDMPLGTLPKSHSAVQRRTVAMPQGGLIPAHHLYRY